MSPKKVPKNPSPVYVLDEGFKIQHAVVFRKNSNEASIRAIPDDQPDTTEVFDKAAPPCIDDFSISVVNYKSLGRWIAHLDEDFWYDSGAAVLLKLSAQKYALIGDRGVMTFELQPKDEVVEFRIRLEGTTPLVWIHGKNNAYLLSSRVFIANSTLVENDGIDNPYAIAANVRADTHPIRNVHFRF